jgi:transcription antitermination factor NusG
VNHRLPILLIPGVSSVVGIGKSALPINPDELHGVRSMLQSGTDCEPWPFLQLGQIVRVTRGPMAGSEGIVVRTKDSYRLVISVSLLQRSVAVEIDRECLEVIPASKSPRLAQRMPDSTILAG